MKHWQIEDIAWDRFEPSQIDPELVPLVKAAAMVERNGVEYAVYLARVFNDDPDFQQATDNWAVEEVQHGDALGRWAMLADPSWDFQTAFQRYRDGYKLPLDVDSSVRGSRTGELIARCMVEIGTSSYYTAMSESATEPVLQQVCHLIAADEYRHFKLFYDHMKRYLGREEIGVLSRLRIAMGRVTETEDDELAYAYYCGNESPDLAYDHRRCIAGYMSKAMGFYRFRHMERSMSMMLKAIGLPPRGRMSAMGARVAWQMLRRRRRKFIADLAHAA